MQLLFLKSLGLYNGDIINSNDAQHYFEKFACNLHALPKKLHFQNPWICCFLTAKFLIYIYLDIFGQ